MYSLNVIVSLNRKRVARVEDNGNRFSSFKASRGGIVLHSASLRSTAFLDTPAVGAFKRRIARCKSERAKSNVIESYFVGA